MKTLHSKFDPLHPRQATDAILEFCPHGLLPYRRILVVLTGTELDTYLLRYLSMLEEFSGPHRMRGGHGLLDSPGHLEGNVSSPSEHKDSLSLFFHNLQRDDRKVLMDVASNEAIDLILVGRSTDQTRRSPSSSLVRYLALEAACPVWVVPDCVTIPRVQNVVVPMDFKASSAQAAAVASALAEVWRIPECLVLHAYFIESRFPSKQYAQALNEQKWHDFAECTSGLRRNGVWLTLHFQEGTPVSKVVCRFVEQRDSGLIVLGTRRRSRHAAALLGSTALDILESSRVPVLVVKASHRRFSFIRELSTAILHPRDVLQTN